MPDYKQGKKYTTRCKTNDTLIYILVVQRSHYVKEWQGINLSLLKDQICVLVIKIDNILFLLVIKIDNKNR